MATQFYNDFIDNVFGNPVVGARIDLDTDNIRHQLTDEGVSAFNAAGSNLGTSERFMVLTS